MDDQYRFLDWFRPRKPRSIYALIGYLYNIPRARATTPAPLAARQQRVVDFRTKGYQPDLRLKIALKAAGDVKARRLTGTASSTAEDLDSDRISVDFLKSMALQIVELPLFADHKYSVIDSVVGKVLSAKLVARGKETDLDVLLELLPEGDAAADRVWSVVQAGVPIGLSIGALITDSKPRTGVGVHGVDLLAGEVVELSIVGVPSQRRSRRLTPV